MLYLFGRLALSDSLDYSENLSDDDFRPAPPGEGGGRPEPEAPAPARQLRAARPCAPASSASAGRLGK